MIKALITFIFGNALWDKLVEYFGSTEEVVTVAVLSIIAFLAIKYFKKFLIGMAILIFILLIISQ